MSTAIEKADPVVLERLAQMVQNAGQSSTYDPLLATSFIKWAMQHTNFIGAAPACPALPQGFELAFTKVEINPDPKMKECYRQSDGGLSLTKTGLEKIQKAAGIKLDPKLTRKLDDGSDTLFAIYEFVGFYRDFDGTICPLKGTRKLDLHDGSDEIKRIRGRQKSEAAGDREISELRRFIDEHCESKAKNRGIRSFGVKSSYTDEEMSRPFTCIRLIRTGRCDDPATQMVLTKMIHEEYQASESMLYGGGHLQLPPAPLGEPVAPMIASRETPTISTAGPSLTEDSQPEPQFCSAEVCYGPDSDGHIKSCAGKVKRDRPAPRSEGSSQCLSEVSDV